MAVLTQKERLAATEARQLAHEREHELGDRVWAAKLDAIDARVRGIERLLLELRLPRGGDEIAPPSRKLSRRDLSMMSGSAAAASIVWWLADVVATAAGG